ncbi:hypothetical protein H9Z51_004107 [Salmonella enterica]|nr:hypothetical protein [Salmonella enterica]
METKTYNVELTAAQAWALAQFVKRTSHSDCLEKSTSEDEAYAMFGAELVHVETCWTGRSPWFIPDNPLFVQNLFLCG